MRTAITMTAAAALAATLAAGPLVAPASAATSGGLVASARHGHERFVMTSHTAGGKDSLRASGVLTATGYALSSALSRGRGTIWLVFRRGSIKLALHVESSSATVPSPRSCAFSEVYRGGYAIRGGHRRYARARGSGTFYTSLTGRLAKVHGTCTARLASIRKYTVTAGSLRW